MDIEKIRSQFPFLKSNPTPIYLDNSATTQKPQTVLDGLVEYYSHHYANVSRGSHRLTKESTQLYEQARQSVSRFIHAPSEQQIVFTKNSTDSVNLLANTIGEIKINTGDIILLSQLEHHSNLLPWIKLAKSKGAEIIFLPLTKEGFIREHEILDDIKDKQVKLVSLAYVSNVFGTINPIRKIFEKIKTQWPLAITIVDAAQAVGRINVNIDHLKCDFLYFSGHKMYGPMGIGVLYGKKDLLEQLEPINLGGGIIREVDWESYRLIRSPHKFEAGTPNVADAFGLLRAIQFIENLGIDNISQHELQLTRYLIDQLQSADITGLTIYGPTQFPIETKHIRTGIVSLHISNISAEDLANYLDDDEIMVRAGHHCAMPLHHHVLNIEKSLRVSFAVYNKKSEVDRFIESLLKAIKMLRD